MIWYYLILFITKVLTAVFTALQLPIVETLPTILDVDIDAMLVQGVSIANSAAHVFWPIYKMFLGTLTILGYLVVKMMLRAFLGHRAPGR
jgi:hypothetical protein